MEGTARLAKIVVTEGEGGPNSLNGFRYRLAAISSALGWDSAFDGSQPIIIFIIVLMGDDVIEDFAAGFEDFGDCR